MNYIDLFSGIGGFALGAYWAGMKFENHYCSDIEPYAVELYKKRFPASIQLGDIREIDCEKLMADADNGRKTNSIQTGRNESEKGSQAEWIITGGFPCQDISVAGKGAGIRGQRSGLWFEMWRIIRDLRPRFAIMENVGALAVRGLTDVLGSLTEIGYDAEWQDIRAQDMGAPHRRERIWIVAYPGCINDNRRSSECGGQEKTRSFNRTSRSNEYSINVADSKCFRQSQSERSEQDERGRFINSGQTMADTEGQHERRLSEREIEKKSRPERRGQDVSDDDGQRCKTERPAESIQTEYYTTKCRDWWSFEPDVGRVAHGIPRRVDRLKGLGNSIVPQIAELLFRQIKEIL